ncbi:MAG: CrcB family protein [Bacteroidales bacterium]|nr:CrcB family protein [Bacteroidales bacterium]
MELIKTILAVGTGSFLGGTARYLISLAMKGISKGFPWATLVVNLVGCFLIGLL